jgi:DNA invertase Pin-like site-specific DNA recombinase
MSLSGHDLPIPFWNTKDKPMKAALYARVSTEDQDNGRQVADLTAFAQRRGFEIAYILEEKASGAKNDRAERAKVMQLARERKIDAILVTELTRWGRSTEDLLSTLQLLADWGVSVIAQTGMEFDLSTAQGKLMLTLMAGFSQFERDLIKERTKSGMAAAKARGKHVGRPTGDRTTAKHGKQVLAMLAEGKTVRAIAEALTISTKTVMKIKNTA